VIVKLTRLDGAPPSKGLTTSEAQRQRLRRELEELAKHIAHDYADPRHRYDAAATKQFIVEELIPKAAAAGIRIDTLSRILGINRRTLRTWRQESEILALAGKPPERRLEAPRTRSQPARPDT
jgi:hypothetical protein